MGIIVIVAVHLQDVTLKVDARGKLVDWNASCLMSGDVHGVSVCNYAYAVCGISLLASLVLSLFLVSGRADTHSAALLHTCASSGAVTPCVDGTATGEAGPKYMPCSQQARTRVTFCSLLLLAHAPVFETTLAHCLFRVVHATHALHTRSS